MILQNNTFWSMSSTNRNISSTDAGFRQKRRSTCQGKMQNDMFFFSTIFGCKNVCLLLALSKLLHTSTTWRIIWASKSSCTWWVLMRRRASQLMSQLWFSTASKQQIFVFVVLFEQWWPYSHLIIFIIVQIVVQNAQLIWGKSLNSGKYCALWIQNFINYHLISEKMDETSIALK